MIDVSNIISSYAESMETRKVLSILPEKTDIEIDPDHLIELLDQEAPGPLCGSYVPAVGYTAEGTINRLHGYQFTTQNGETTIDTQPHADDSAADLAVSIGDRLTIIDRHFRDQVRVLPIIPLTPIVSVLYGEYTDKAMGNNELHFDYGCSRPVVSYKINFAGKPEHTSIYYPGLWQLPPKLTPTQLAINKATGAEEGRIKNLFPANEFRSIAVPFGVVCLEPWNALHSGPTHPDAQNTIRGILGVSYDLSQLPET